MRTYTAIYITSNKKFATMSIKARNPLVAKITAEEEGNKKGWAFIGFNR